MNHNADTKSQFIELRVHGASLKSIAQTLHLSERTLIRWNHQFKTEISDQRSLFMEAVHEKVIPKYGAELSRMTNHLNHVESILAQRRLDCLSTEYLFHLASSLRAQIRNRSLTPVFSVPPDDESPDASQPDASQPDASQPDAPQPVASQPVAPQPNAPKTEAGQ